MEEINLCETPHFNAEAIVSVKKSMPNENYIVEISEIFKLISNPTRLKIVLAIMAQELCVCDISNILNLSQSAISHQLRVLRGARLAKYRKQGKMVYYSIDDDHVSSMIKMALEHISHK